MELRFASWPPKNLNSTEYDCKNLNSFVINCHVYHSRVDCFQFKNNEFGKNVWKKQKVTTYAGSAFVLLHATAKSSNTPQEPTSDSQLVLACPGVGIYVSLYVQPALRACGTGLAWGGRYDPNNGLRENLSPSRHAYRWEYNNQMNLLIWGGTKRLGGTCFSPLHR